MFHHLSLDYKVVDFGYSYCKAQPKPQLNQAEAQLDLFSVDPPDHQPVNVYVSSANTSQWSNQLSWDFVW